MWTVNAKPLENTGRIRCPQVKKKWPVVDTRVDNWRENKGSESMEELKRLVDFADKNLVEFAEGCEYREQVAQGAENIRALILELHDCAVPEEALEADLEYSAKNGDTQATTALEFLCETIWNHIPVRCARCNDEIKWNQWDVENSGLCSYCGHVLHKSLKE